MQTCILKLHFFCFRFFEIASRTTTSTTTTTTPAPRRRKPKSQRRKKKKKKKKNQQKQSAQNNSGNNNKNKGGNFNSFSFFSSQPSDNTNGFPNFPNSIPTTEAPKPTVHVAKPKQPPVAIESSKDGLRAGPFGYVDKGTFFDDKNVQGKK